MNESSILPCDHLTARHYGEIKTKLWNAGKPIPDNDIWIAALAMQYDVPISTRDRHFQYIEGLRVDIP
ncbi:MAG TPA: PIN domain-containing protein [Phycisphaerae bacterium]|nr:PIN domain-containing protein [Phycisphaerae bacterium]